jgi:hypothetical protein
VKRGSDGINFDRTELLVIKEEKRQKQNGAEKTDINMENTERTQNITAKKNEKSKVQFIEIKNRGL